MMNEPLTDVELARIEGRLSKALEVAPAPWSPGLETRMGLGGCSFVQLGGDPNVDNELYFELRLGREQVVSPDERLDAVVDFLGNAAGDVSRLLTELRRLRRLLPEAA